MLPCFANGQNHCGVGMLKEAGTPEGEGKAGSTFGEPFVDAEKASCTALASYIFLSFGFVACPLSRPGRAAEIQELGEPGLLAEGQGGTAGRRVQRARAARA